MKLSHVKFIVPTHVPILKLQGSLSAEPRVSDSGGYDIELDDEMKFVRIESLRTSLPNPNDLPVYVPITNVGFFRVVGDKNTMGAEKAKRLEVDGKEAEKKRLEQEKKDGEKK